MKSKRYRGLRLAGCLDEELLVICSGRYCGTQHRRPEQHIPKETRDKEVISVVCGVVDEMHLLKTAEDTCQPHLFVK